MLFPFNFFFVPYILITIPNHVMVDCRLQTLFANNVAESTYALPEKTKRGPPTNKNIPVRNMKAQIASMSLNENTGFKSEYHVRFFENDFFYC